MTSSLPRPNHDARALSPITRDDDTSSLHSAERSDQDTDSEDDEVLQGARTSTELREHDHSVLLEEEERDQLLEQSRERGRRGSALALTPLKKLFARSYAELPGPRGSSEMEQDPDKGTDRRARRRARRARKKRQLLDQAARGEDGQLIYEMEEGSMKEGSTTGDGSETERSDELDQLSIRDLYDEKPRKNKRWRGWCFTHLLIVTGFAILVLVAWKLSLERNGTIATQSLVSNGTALFAPTTILISLDGFRADFLKRGLTPSLNSFILEGVSPVYMTPSFPSVTFPNHYTLATGLYPEAHGIVGNTFWDPELKEEFYYTHPLAMQPKWWGGEPLWVTAENSGIRTAVHMWPGSEAHIMDIEPAFLDKFDGDEPLPNKVARILELLDKPGQENGLAKVADMRPQLIAAYVPNVDSDGHKYGPNSTEIRTTIADVDTMLGQIFHGLEARNLSSIVNVVVVSDHGMATTDISRLIQLEDIVDASLIEHTDGWPLYGLRPKDPAHLQKLYDRLSVEASKTSGFEVYLRDENMPSRYHFSKNERIAPLWIVPRTGWAIVTKEEFDIKDAKEKGSVYHPRGLHGYDHEHPLMRAIFVARGPAFPHVGNSRIEPFQNTEVYNIVCDSLGLTPKPNNGTLRLPLHPNGSHTSETYPDEPQDPEPQDANPSPPPSFSSAAPMPNVPSAASNPPLNPTLSLSPPETPSTVVGVDSPGSDVERPTATDEGVTTEEDKGFWEWLTTKVDGFKTWLTGAGSGGEGPKP